MPFLTKGASKDSNGLPVDTVTDEDGRTFVKYHVNDVYPDHVLIYRFHPHARMFSILGGTRFPSSFNVKGHERPGGQQDLEAHRRHQVQHAVLQGGHQVGIGGNRCP